MTEPVFHEVKTVDVPAKGDALWTLALPYIPGGVRVRIEVVDPQAKWKIGGKLGALECTAGGIRETSAAALVPFAPRGALVAKIGGSNSDCPSPPATTPGAFQPPPGVKLFTVGSYGLLTVGSSDGGPLFLTMNDEVEKFGAHDGQLTVKISISVG